ncbi:DUF2808 domain-containing protein [Phormidium tenue FACHB-886]|nr:DUF2808 domain-containing protein [Phormidium tenue FACHB-886]
MFKKSSVLGLFSVLAIVASFTVGLSTMVKAQGTSGFTIFSGVERENQLGYALDYDGRLGARDRYHLRIPARKLEFAISKLAISYPDTYEGRFDADSVRVEAADKEIVLDEVTWDQENRVIEIYPQEPIPADTRLEIVLSNVRNPTRVGTHYFNASVQSPGDLPLMRYVGTWILSIGNDD